MKSLSRTLFLFSDCGTSQSVNQIFFLQFLPHLLHFVREEKREYGAQGDDSGEFAEIIPCRSGNAFDNIFGNEELEPERKVMSEFDADIRDENISANALEQK